MSCLLTGLHAFPLNPAAVTWPCTTRIPTGVPPRPLPFLQNSLHYSIPVAVLSVCSTQYKTVLDALRGRKERFLFEDVEVSLKQSVMAFITMNPGYPGRAGGRRVSFWPSFWASS